MSELISGKDVLIALADGKEAEYYDENLEGWVSMDMTSHHRRKFRLKPLTITLNGIEVPAPFKPKDREYYWHIDIVFNDGYASKVHLSESPIQFGAWRTEDEIKQVVAALRSIFNAN